MKKTKDAFEAQLTTAEKQNLVACVASAGATHVEITVLADDNSRLVSAGNTPSPRTIEAETQDWYDVIHAQPNVYGSSVYGGYLKVYDRPVFCGIEGIEGFGHDTGTPIGTASSAATDGNSTWCGRYYRYLYNHITAAKIATGDIQTPVPEITGHLFGGSPFTNQAGAISFINHCKTIADAFAASVGKTIIFQSNPNFSEVSSGYWSGYGSQGNVVCYDYYGGIRGSHLTTPADYAYEVSEIFAGRSIDGYGISTGGLPQSWGEWGDLSGSIRLIKGAVRSGDNFVAGTTTLEQWQEYWLAYLKAIKALVNAGKVTRFNYWGGWENQNTSIFYKTGSGDSAQYFLNWRGQMLANFFISDGMGRIPVVTAGTFTEASPSFGGRNMHW